MLKKISTKIYSSHLNFCLCCRGARNPHVGYIHSGCSFSRRLAKNPIAVSILFLFSYGFPLLASASIPGFYILGQLGTADTHQEASNAAAQSINSKMAFSGRIAGGYQFNQNIAFEIGYTRFSDVDFSGVGGVPGQNVSLSENAIDFMAKPMLPISSNVNLYAKLGLAYLKANGSAFVNGRSYLGYSDSWNPSFGLGLSYDITPFVPIDLAWTRIQSVGGGNSIPSTDFYSIGLAYYFG
jgi:OmpA-OmpF porin, OOP family